MFTEDLLVNKILMTDHKSNTIILYKPPLNRHDVKLQLINQSLKNYDSIPLT